MDDRVEWSRAQLQEPIDWLADARHARMVAVRTALRTIQRVRGITSGVWSWGHEDGERLIVQALRLLFVHWVDFTFGGVEPSAVRQPWESLGPLLTRFDGDLPDFYHRNIMGSDYGCASMQDETERGRRALALVEAVATLSYRPQPFDRRRAAYATMLDTADFSFHRSAYSDEAWPRVQVEAHGADCVAVAQMDPQRFMLSPLWPSAEGAALATHALRHDVSLELRKEGQSWSTRVGSDVSLWLRERRDGYLVSAQPPAATRHRLVRAANLPDAFWTGRSPAETLQQFDYLFTGALDNPHWGAC